jgi:hypothetical protein
MVYFVSSSDNWQQGNIYILSSSLLGSKETSLHIIATIVFHWLTYLSRLVQNGWMRPQRKATPTVGISFLAARSQHDQVARPSCHQAFWTPTSRSHLYAIYKQGQTEKKQSIYNSLALWFTEKWTRVWHTEKKQSIYNPSSGWLLYTDHTGLLSSNLVCCITTSCGSLNLFFVLCPS